MTEMLSELDPDIEITSENIVNPGKKKKEPLGEVDFFLPFLSCFPKNIFLFLVNHLLCSRFSTSS